VSRLRPVIVHVLPWQLCVGGAQRFIADLAAWARPWADVHIVHLARGSDESWQHLLDQVVTHPADDPIRAAAIVESLAPDLMHHHYPTSSWGIQGLEKRFPLIGTPHGWEGNLNAPEWAVRVCGPRAQIPHGVDLDLYKPMPRPAPDGRCHVGIVGRLRWDKIPRSFLDALQAWLPSQRGAVVVHFIGRGLDDRFGRHAQTAVRRIAGARVHGDIPPDQMPGIYNQLDAVLIPSARDSVSLVAIEAMACGIPVVARAIEGLPDTIGEAGLVCADDQALLKAVEKLRQNRALRLELGRRGRQRAVSLYDRRRMLQQYGDEYRRRTRGLVRAPQTGIDVNVAMPVADGVQPDWLRDAVKSVLAQQGVVLELLLVSDGVADPDLIHAIDDVEAPVRGVRVIRLEKNMGISAAVNRALWAASADLIARADADDIMPPGRLAAQVAFMRQRPDVTLLCGDMKSIRPDGGLDPMPSCVLRDDQPLWEYWEGNWPIAHPTVMYRRYPVLAIGGYDETVFCEDLDLWCRLQAAGHRFAKLPVVWNHYRRHANQYTARHAEIRRSTKQVLDRYRQRSIG